MATFESFQSTLNGLINMAQAQGVTLNTGLIAQKLNMTESQIATYFNNDDAPLEVLTSLRETFRDILGDTHFNKISFLVDEEDDLDPETPPLDK